MAKRPPPSPEMADSDANKRKQARFDNAPVDKHIVSVFKAALLEGRLFDREGSFKPAGFRASDLQSLPVLHDHNLQSIFQALKEPFSVIIGEPGCGKTTQVPKILWFWRQQTTQNPTGARIVVILPTLQAMQKTAQRLAEELNVELGQEVGYSCEDEVKASATTRIEAMTPAVFLEVILRQGIEAACLQYPTVILDEAHDRSLQFDTIAAIILPCMQRLSLKVVIMSAAINQRPFQRLVGDKTGVVEIEAPSRYTIQYLPSGLELGTMKSFAAVLNGLWREDKGSKSLLGFFASRRSVKEKLETLSDPRWKKELKEKDNIVIKEFTPTTHMSMQKQILDGTKARQAILATNIAESSLTIADLHTVFDSGLVERLYYQPCIGAYESRFEAISQSSARQRAGRAGRSGRVGLCCRDYSLKTYSAMRRFDPDPFTYSKLTWPMLALRQALPLVPIPELKHRFLTCPHDALLSDAIEQLVQLRLLKDDGSISTLGQDALSLGCDVSFAVTLLKAHALGYLDQVLPVVVMMTWNTIGDAGMQLAKKLESHHPTANLLKEEGGDGICLLAEHIMYPGGKASFFATERARLRERLERICEVLPLSTLPLDFEAVSEDTWKTWMLAIQVSFCHGFPNNIAQRVPPDPADPESHEARSRYQTAITKVEIEVPSHAFRVQVGSERTPPDWILFTGLTTQGLLGDPDTVITADFVITLWHSYSQISRFIEDALSSAGSESESFEVLENKSNSSLVIREGFPPTTTLEARQIEGFEVPN